VSPLYGAKRTPSLSPNPSAHQFVYGQQLRTFDVASAESGPPSWVVTNTCSRQDERGGHCWHCYVPTGTSVTRFAAQWLRNVNATLCDHTQQQQQQQQHLYDSTSISSEEKRRARQGWMDHRKDGRWFPEPLYSTVLAPRIDTVGAGYVASCRYNYCYRLLYIQWTATNSNELPLKRLEVCYVSRGTWDHTHTHRDSFSVLSLSVPLSSHMSSFGAHKYKTSVWSIAWRLDGQLSPTIMKHAIWC